jgi:hypothetical protein
LKHFRLGTKQFRGVRGAFKHVLHHELDALTVMNPCLPSLEDDGSKVVGDAKRKRHAVKPRGAYQKKSSGEVRASAEFSGKSILCQGFVLGNER